MGAAEAAGLGEFFMMVFFAEACVGGACCVLGLLTVLAASWRTFGAPSCGACGGGLDKVADLVCPRCKHVFERDGIVLASSWDRWAMRVTGIGTMVTGGLLVLASPMAPLLFLLAHWDQLR